jgi:hypothetical protein
MAQKEASEETKEALKQLMRIHAGYLYGFGRNHIVAKELLQLSIIAEEVGLKEIGYLFVELMLYCKGSEACLYAHWNKDDVKHDVIITLSWL